MSQVALVPSAVRISSYVVIADRPCLGAPQAGVIANLVLPYVDVLLNFTEIYTLQISFSSASE